MPNYVYALCAFITIVTLVLGGLIWSEVTTFKQTPTTNNGELYGWGETSANSAPVPDRTSERNSLSRLFVTAQPEYQRAQWVASTGTSDRSAVDSHDPSGDRMSSPVDGVVAPNINRTQSSRSKGINGSMPKSYPGSSANATPACQTGDGTHQENSPRASTQAFIRKNPLAEPMKLPSAEDDPYVDCNGSRARTYSSYDIQPATDLKNPVEKASKRPDDSKVAVAQGMQPAVDKKKTVIEINPEFEYGLSTELPTLGSYMPASFSTEKVAADILCDELRTAVMPKLAMPPLAEGDAALRKDSRQWKVSLSPRWRRTEFSCAEGKPSSQVNVFTLQPQITYIKNDLELSATPWLEHDDISGAIDHDSFSRMGIALSPVYRVFRQENGRPLDFSVGADVFCNYNIGDYSYVTNQMQYGGGLGIDASRQFLKFITLGGGAGVQRSDRDAGDLPGNFDLYHADVYLGFQLGKKFSLTPGIAYYHANKEGLPLTSWTDTKVAMAYALSKSLVLNGTVGFHTDPMESYYIKTGVGLKF